MGLIYSFPNFVLIFSNMDFSIRVMMMVMMMMMMIMIIIIIIIIIILFAWLVRPSGPVFLVAEV